MAGAQLQLAPLSGALPGRSKFTVRLSASIGDVFGQTLATSINRTFTTADQTWGTTPATVASLPFFTGGTAPRVTVDDAGNVTAAWNVRAGVEDSLFAARWDAVTGLWSPPVAVRTISSTGATLAGIEIVADRPSNAYLIWTEIDPNEDKVLLARYSAASNAWSAPEEVSAVPEIERRTQRALPIVDPFGNLTLLTWTSSRLFATRRNALTGVWSPPAALEKAVANNSIFKFGAVADQHGAVTAVWTQADDPGRSIYAARYNSTVGTWSTAQLVAAFGAMSGASGNLLSLGVAADGAVTAVWQRDGGISGYFTVEAARFDPAANAWMPPVRVDASTSGANYPSVAVDAAGTSTATWTQGDGLYASRLPAKGVSWSVPERLVSGFAFSSSPAAMAADVAGNVSVVFVLDQRANAIHYFDLDGKWGAPIPIGTPATATLVFTNQPTVALDRAGSLTAVWFAQTMQNNLPQYLVSSNQFR